MDNSTKRIEKVEEENIVPLITSSESYESFESSESSESLEIENRNDDIVKNSKYFERIKVIWIGKSKQ